VTLNSIEYWVLAQVGLEIILVLLLVFFLLKIRSMSKLLQNFQEEEESVTSNFGKLSDQLALLDKKRLTLEETLELLGEKASTLREQSTSRRLAASEPYNAVSPNPGGSSLRLQVEDLHLQGLSLTEISRRLGLHPTEVKMALDLARLKAE